MKEYATMKSKLTLGLAILTGVLGGCAVGPNYHPPKSAMPASWSEVKSGGIITNTALASEWWKTFNDPVLNSLISRAVTNNLDLRISEGRLREARALRAGAYWNLGPTITGTGSYLDRQQSKNAQSAPLSTYRTDLYDARFDASWEIDIFGGLRRQVENANALFQTVLEDKHAVLISTLAEVARNYIEVRGYQRRQSIATDNIKAQAETVEIVRARFNAGLTSELDVKRAEALLATSRAQLPALDTATKIGIHQLGVLLGQQPGALRAELAMSAPVPITPPVVPVGLPSELLRRRPDVRRAERQLAADTAGIGVATAELFPKFSLLGTGGLQSLSAGDWFTGGSKYWTAGPMVKWRLFDLGHVRSQIQAAHAHAEQTLAAYEKSVLGALADVENALVAYANEQVRQGALAEAVAANRRALELANNLYTKGLGDFLNVLDAERSLDQTADQLADSERAVASNLVTLYKALGGGWEVETKTKVIKK